MWVKHEYFEANYDRHESRRGAQSRWIFGWSEAGDGMGTMIQSQLDRGVVSAADRPAAMAVHNAFAGTELGHRIPVAL